MIFQLVGWAGAASMSGTLLPNGRYPCSTGGARLPAAEDYHSSSCGVSKKEDGMQRPIDHNHRYEHSGFWSSSMFSHPSLRAGMYTSRSCPSTARR
jgi:hypothetical protein